MRNSEKVHRSSLAFKVFTQSSAIVFARTLHAVHTQYRQKCWIKVHNSNVAHRVRPMSWRRLQTNFLFFIFFKK